MTQRQGDKPHDSLDHQKRGQTNNEMRTCRGNMEEKEKEEVLDLTQQDDEQSESEDPSSKDEEFSPDHEDNKDDETPRAENKKDPKGDPEITKIVDNDATKEDEGTTPEKEQAPNEKESPQQQGEEESTTTAQQGDACNDVEVAANEKPKEAAVADMIEQQPTTMAHEEAKMHAKMLVQITETLTATKKNMDAVKKRMDKMTNKAKEAETIWKALVRTKTTMTQHRAMADLAEKHDKERRGWDKETAKLRDEATALRNQIQTLHTRLQQATVTSQIQNRASGTLELMHELKSTNEATQKTAKKRKSAGGKTKATATPKKKAKTAVKSPKEKSPDKDSDEHAKARKATPKKKAVTITESDNSATAGAASPPEKQGQKSWGNKSTFTGWIQPWAQEEDVQKGTGTQKDTTVIGAVPLKDKDTSGTDDQQPQMSSDSRRISTSLFRKDKLPEPQNTPAKQWRRVQYKDLPKNKQIILGQYSPFRAWEGMQDGTYKLTQEILQVHDQEWFHMISERTVMADAYLAASKGMATLPSNQ